ncbi:copper resistance protein CopC [uncultured Modestobacter sp.]|uniref:copper resistance CopC family protein n=1 Tax=uncultured Modestobacter sp. TaxID=380048 RepID=UPI0026392F96|nr:copper resistance protein CopC [uncultured Modestobacter sp.]
MTALRAPSPVLRVTPAPRRRTAGLPALLTVLILAVLVLAAGVGPARAHDGLVRTSPGSGAAVTSSPTVVELEFTGEPLPLGTQVVVTGPDGGSVSDGAAEISGRSVVQPLADGVPAGDYTVEWRSTSSDGHALTGSFAFTVATAPAPATSAAASAEGTTAPAADGSTGTNPGTELDGDPALAEAGRATGNGPAVGWLIAAGAVLVGAVAVLVRSRRRS